jgi:hypothetical protein
VSHCKQRNEPIGSTVFGELLDCLSRWFLFESDVRWLSWIRFVLFVCLWRYSAVPPYPQVLCATTYVKPQIIPNAIYNMIIV